MTFQLLIFLRQVLLLLLVVSFVITLFHLILHNCDSLTFIDCANHEIKDSMWKTSFVLSPTLVGDISSNMNSEEFALPYTNTRSRERADNQRGAGIMVKVVMLHVGSLHCNCTLDIYSFYAHDRVQSDLEARAVSFTAVCLQL